jgi:Reverse transcriptase (RNA-dependent DNA polymerase)
MAAIRELYKVCKLNKALYSLKQSPHVWYFTLTAYLKTLSFKPLTANNCIFYDSKGIYIVVFVNDLLIVSLFKANISIIKAKLSERFYITDLGPYKYYLRIEVIRD